MPDTPNLKSKLAKALKVNRKDTDDFPRHDVDYYDRFVRLDAHLNERVHPSVNQGATAADQECANQEATSANRKRAIWLTDHGPKHIETVIRRADALAFTPAPVLNPYEVYILLLAIHFHDVGNIFGRDGHEQRIREVMTGLDASLIGDDTPEQRLICKIATAHGGYVDGLRSRENKNTIEPLRYLSKNKHCRAALLAGILRFADELAEDKTRTDRFLVDQQLITPECELYHRFALCLEPIQIDSEEHVVEIHFDLNLDLVMRTFQKGVDQVYLIDEILERSLKMHYEHVYCSRFMEPFIHIAQIHVTVAICSEDYGTVHREIKYSMATQGYPDSPSCLSEICDNLRGITGETVRDHAEANFCTVQEP